MTDSFNRTEQADNWSGSGEEEKGGYTEAATSNDNNEASDWWCWNAC
jgi:hypothetical protein